MSRTLHFGRDILSAPDVDLEDLLSALAPSEVNQLVEEMAADPDDKHLPASVRTAYKCSKQPTGPLNRVGWKLLAWDPLILVFFTASTVVWKWKFCCCCCWWWCRWRFPQATRQHSLAMAPLDMLTSR